MNRFRIVGVFLLCLTCFAHDDPMIKLVLKHNGHDLPTPEEAALAYNENTLRIALRNGVFKVPIDVISAKRVMFSLDIGGDRITIPNLPGDSFAMEFWTLHVADQQYDLCLQHAVPKGASIRKSCVIVFESKTVDVGYSVFVPNCRSGKK